MDFMSLVYQLIDLRSFSNLWYWIALAFTWSRAAHWILGVPWDMVQRARRVGGPAELDFQMLLRANLNRIGYISQVAGTAAVAIVSALLTSLAMLGFGYGVEFCQALFLIVFPMSLVGLMSLRMAHWIDAAGVEGAALHRALAWHRVRVQALGLVSIFITAMWGMLQNLNLSVLY
nr:component of SufBCD complex [Frigidibacter mobilis]